jgi:hypothetical protein
VKRGKPLQRRTRLERKTRIRQRRPSPRRRAFEPSEDDNDYLDFLRSQRICGVVRASIVGRLRPELRQYIGKCGGRMEVEHERHGVGAGQKAPNARSWECCSQHHRQRHDKRGVWAHLTLDEERSLIAGNIDDARARYMSHGSRRAA